LEGSDRLDRYYPHMDETRKACRILIGKTEEKRLLGRSNSRMQDNTKVGLQSIRDVVVIEGGHIDIDIFSRFQNV
jgi:hypothetical protein